MQYNDEWKIKMTITSPYSSGMLREGKSIKERLFGNTHGWFNCAPFKVSDTSAFGWNGSGWAHAEHLAEAAPRTTIRSLHKNHRECFRKRKDEKNLLF